MKITLIDGNNWFRRRVEANHTGRAVSDCFYEIQTSATFPIIIWDGRKSLVARREIFSEYKKGRTPAGESFYASQKMMSDLLQLGKGLTIQVDGFEADDVIAHLCRDLQNKGHEIDIQSNDADFAQLDVPMCGRKFKTEAKWVTLYKTVVGDTSDNIKGAKGFGDGTFQKFDQKQLALLETIILSYLDAPEDRVCEHLDSLPIPKGLYNWLKIRDNRKLLMDYNKIVNFLPVDAQLIADNTITNSNTPELADPIFQEFML